MLVGATLETALGWIGLAFSARGLRHLTFPRDSARETRRDLEDLGVFGPADPALVEPTARAVEQFAEARPIDLSTIALDLEGYPPFWVDAWQIIRSIPWGSTMTYGDVAEAAGRPRAARAAGQATAHNPVAFVIPCHRVVASNGLGGYGGLESFKVELLRREGSWPLRPRAAHSFEPLAPR